MDKMLQCDCGFEARADDEEGLVAAVQRHARDAHGMALTHDEALLLAFGAERNKPIAQATTSRDTTTPTEEET